MIIITSMVVCLSGSSNDGILPIMAEWQSRCPRAQIPACDAQQTGACPQATVVIVHRSWISCSTSSSAHFARLACELCRRPLLLSSWYKGVRECTNETAVSTIHPGRDESPLHEHLARYPPCSYHSTSAVEAIADLALCFEAGATHVAVRHWLLLLL